MPTNRAGHSCGLAKTAHAGLEVVAVGGESQGTLAKICLPFVGCVKIPSPTYMADIVEIFNVGRREWRKGGTDFYFLLCLPSHLLYLSGSLCLSLSPSLSLSLSFIGVSLKRCGAYLLN